MSNAQKKILMAISRIGIKPIIIDECDRDIYEDREGAWIVESYVLETEADKIVQQTCETVASAENTEVEKRRRDLFEQVALRIISHSNLEGRYVWDSYSATLITNQILVATDKFAKGEK